MYVRVYQGCFTLDKKVLAWFANTNGIEDKNTFEYPNSIGIRI